MLRPVGAWIAPLSEQHELPLWDREALRRGRIFFGEGDET
jgi:hypothetical protein